MGGIIQNTANITKGFIENLYAFGQMGCESMTHVTKDKLNHHERLVWEDGFKAGQESKLIPSHVRSEDAARVADEMVRQARKETLEEVEKQINEFLCNRKKEMLTRLKEDNEAKKKRM